jgi:hypothetical protein
MYLNVKKCKEVEIGISEFIIAFEGVGGCWKTLYISSCYGTVSWLDRHRHMDMVIS